MQTASVLLALALIASLCWLARSWRAEPEPHAGPWRRGLERYRADSAAMSATYLLITIIVLTILAPWIVPYDPTAQRAIVAEQAPTLLHPFGTDFANRDVLSRVLYGGRVSLSVAILSVLLSATIGTGYGALAGLAGGRTDAIMMRFLDGALSVPRLFLLIAILALWGRISTGLLIVVLGATGWFDVSRLVRAEVLHLKTEEWVTAARALGVRRWRLLYRHLVPNALSSVIVSISLGVGNLIILEAGLAYLGIGVQEPTPSWGSLIRDGGFAISGVWWLFVFPSAAIVLTVISFNVVGDALRDALDPRQVGRR